MRTVIWFIRAAFYIIAAIPDMHRAKKLEESGETEKFRAFVDVRVAEWARSMLANAGVTVEVHGTENLPEAPSVFISNHQSDWDIPVLLGYLDKPHGIVAKDSLSRIPLVRTWMRYINCIFIDRSDVRQAIRQLIDAGSHISEGFSITVFPEGTRSRGEDIGEFKLGAFKTAFKYNAPIVPVSIDGTYKIMEANGGKRIKPAHVILTILPSIDTAGMDKVTQKSLAGEVKASILNAREQSRRAYKCNDLSAKTN